MNIYTKFARALIPLAITVATLACNSVGQIPPTPKPAPIGQTKTVELSTDILLTDVFGDDAVGIDQDGDLWLMNTRTGDSRQLTGDGHPKWGAALSADYVAWIDQRRMIQLPGYPPNTPIFSSDVFVRNRHTGEERRITDAPASRHALGMSGARLVWQDNRKGLLEDRRWDFDIYAYDLDHDLEIQVAVTPGRQEMPAIHGDTVVWTHNPNPPARGTAKPGSTTKPTTVLTSTRTTWPPTRKDRWWKPVTTTGSPPSTANWWCGNVSGKRASLTSSSWTLAPGNRQ